MRKLVLWFVIFLYVGVFVNVANAIEKTSTGFYYPIGTSNFNQACGTWLGRDDFYGGCYDEGLYHIGVDMMTYDTDADVYAISAGVIFYRDCSSSWGAGNCALLIRHELVNGNVFTAFYGHLRESTIPTSDSVYAGQIIGKTGDFNGIHLHFGIRMGDSLSPSPWGRLPNIEWSDTNGFVDPIAFIKNNLASQRSSSITLRIVNGIGWYPSNKTCVNASQWYKTVDGKAIASYADNSACYLVGIEYYNSIIWHDVLFGTGDLPEECTQ